MLEIGTVNESSGARTTFGESGTSIEAPPDAVANKLALLGMVPLAIGIDCVPVEKNRASAGFVMTSETAHSCRSKNPTLGPPKTKRCSVIGYFRKRSAP